MKRFIGLLAAGLLCMSGYAAPSQVTEVKTGGTTLQNVAINKYVWASSYRAMAGTSSPLTGGEGAQSEHLSYFPAGVVTGATSGNYPWMSRLAEGGMEADPCPWVAVDLGKAYRAEYIDLYMPAGHSGVLEVFASNARTVDTNTNVALDNGELTDAVKLGEIELNPAGGYMRFYIDSGEKFRYYKIARPEGISASLTVNQLCIYAQDTANTLNLSFGKTFNADFATTSTGAILPSDALTGLTDGLFPGAQSNDNGWFAINHFNNRATIDLGDEYIIDRVDITAESNPWEIGHAVPQYRRSYEIYGGNILDGNHVSGALNKLHTQLTTTGPVGSVISHDIVSEEPVRYITYQRIRQEDSDQHIHIAEITVYGHKAETEDIVLEKVYENTAVNADTIDLGGIYDVKYIELSGENLDDFYLLGSLEEDAPRHRMTLLAETAEANVTTNNFVRWLKAVPKGENPQPVITSASVYATEDGKLMDYAVLSEITPAKTAVVDGKADTSVSITADEGGVVFCLDKNLPVSVQGVQATMAQTSGGNQDTRTVLEVYGSTDGADYTLIGRTSKQDIPDMGVLSMGLDGQAWKYIKIVPKKGELMGNLINYPGFGGTPYTTGSCNIADVKILVYEKDEPREVSAVFDRANKKISYTFRNFSQNPKSYNYIAVAVDENGFISGSFKEEGTALVTVNPGEEVPGEITFATADSLPANAVMKLYLWDSLSGMQVLAPHISEAE